MRYVSTFHPSQNHLEVPCSDRRGCVPRWPRGLSGRNRGCAIVALTYVACVLGNMPSFALFRATPLYTVNLFEEELSTAPATTASDDELSRMGVDRQLMTFACCHSRVPGYSDAITRPRPSGPRLRGPRPHRPLPKLLPPSPITFSADDVRRQRRRRLDGLHGDAAKYRLVEHNPRLVGDSGDAPRPGIPVPVDRPRSVQPRHPARLRVPLDQVGDGFLHPGRSPHLLQHTADSGLAPIGASTSPRQTKLDCTRPPTPSSPRPP